MARFSESNDEYADGFRYLQREWGDGPVLTCPVLPKHLTAAEVDTVIDCYVRAKGNRRALAAEALANERRCDEIDIACANKALEEMNAREVAVGDQLASAERNGALAGGAADAGGRDQDDTEAGRRADPEVAGNDVEADTGDAGLAEAEIDTSDIPEVGEDWFKRAKLRMPE